MGASVMSDLDSIALSILYLVGGLKKKTCAADDGGGCEAVSQIVSVLNSHIDTLQYLDETSNQVSRRVGDVAEECESYGTDGKVYSGSGRRNSTNSSSSHALFLDCSTNVLLHLLSSDIRAVGHNLICRRSLSLYLISFFVWL